jgi:hypothetical protein
VGKVTLPQITGLSPWIVIAVMGILFVSMFRLFEKKGLWPLRGILALKPPGRPVSTRRFCVLWGPAGRGVIVFLLFSSGNHGLPLA